MRPPSLEEFRLTEITYNRAQRMEAWFTNKKQIPVLWAVLFASPLIIYAYEKVSTHMQIREHWLLILFAVGIGVELTRNILAILLNALRHIISLSPSFARAREYNDALLLHKFEQKRIQREEKERYEKSRREENAALETIRRNLAENRENGIRSQIEQAARERERSERERRHDALFWQQLSGREFEQELCKVFEGLGYAATRVGGTGDGGVDIILSNKKGRIIVQCKAHRNPIGVSEVREMMGAMVFQEASRAALASISGFTGPARASRLEFPGKKLRLWDINDIVRFQRYSEWVKAHHVP